MWDAPKIRGEARGSGKAGSLKGQPASDDQGDHEECGLRSREGRGEKVKLPHSAHVDGFAGVSQASGVCEARPLPSTPCVPASRAHTEDTLSLWVWV